MPYEKYDPLGMFEHLTRPCDKCSVQPAVMVPDRSGHLIFTKGDTGSTAMYPLKKTDLCYFHTKKEQGLFGTSSRRATALEELMSGAMAQIMAVKGRAKI